MSENGSGRSGRRRVVVTGLGMVSPLGTTVEDSWTALLAGESGAAPITQFDTTGFPVDFACEVKNLEVTDYVDYKASRRMDRFTHLALAAARQAETDAGLEIAKEPDRIGAAVATGIGGLKSFESCIQVLDNRGPERVNPFSIVQIIPNLAAGWVSMELGTKGPLLSECTACAASNMALGDGLDAIRLGRADVMICGGTEAPVSRVGIAGFGAMRAISRRNDDPKRASRPFDLERDGFVMGEAGSMIVLEDLEHARARGAKIYAELLGYGVSSDATHVSDPDPTGQSPARALEMAFADAGISPDEVGYINAHGTSTPVGDSAETRVIKLALGEEKAHRTPISSTKGATGHCLGAAGAVEASFTILALERGMLPPTINQEVADPECDLDYIPNEARAEQVEVGVSNSFGFGGHNACVVFRRWGTNGSPSSPLLQASEPAERD
jgi:3-oxoacyl-[acyl-carrier-protein] synthase II